MVMSLSWTFMLSSAAQVRSTFQKFQRDVTFKQFSAVNLASAYLKRDNMAL
jgi:hypothetical protein